MAGFRNMRSLGLALLAPAFTASPATAAVIELEDHFCGCDGSSGDTDTVGIIVRAAPGELNRMTVRQLPRGILIEDAGAPLTGRCRASRSGGRLCGGAYDGVEVRLGDGDDQIRHEVGGLIDGGEGDDDILGTQATFRLIGGPGAVRLEANGMSGSSVSYLDHIEGVTVRLNGLADDGAPGEGDNVLGAITGSAAGRATTTWRPARPRAVYSARAATTFSPAARRTTAFTAATGTTSCWPATATTTSPAPAALTG